MAHGRRLGLRRREAGDLGRRLQAAPVRGGGGYTSLLSVSPSRLPVGGGWGGGGHWVLPDPAQGEQWNQCRHLPGAFSDQTWDVLVGVLGFVSLQLLSFNGGGGDVLPRKHFQAVLLTGSKNQRR